MPDFVHTVVVGAGVIGLAIARECARSGREVLLLERATQFGSATSSRNSEVLHAGLYYPPGSLKATLCVQGRDALMHYCDAHHIPHRLCGKLIVATQPQDEAALNAIATRARACGVHTLQPLSAAQARALEPALHCTATLLSPATGIVDSHALMLALLGEAGDHGAALATHSTVLQADRQADGFRLQVDCAGEPYALNCRELVNAAGLGAVALAQRIDALAPQHVPRLHRAKGNYFSYSGRAPFSHLIYPVPVQGGLGVHLTLDLAGQARFGPDVQWLSDDAPEDYAVDAQRAAGFARDIQGYWPALQRDRLQPAYSGIRPKLSGPGEPAADFGISGPQQHGLSGLVNLFGIESPGLTACLAIAQQVLACLQDDAA